MTFCYQGWSQAVDKRRLGVDPRDALRRAGLCDSDVFGCLAGCPSVCHSQYCIKTETASVMISSPSDSPMISLSGEVWFVDKFSRVRHPQRGRFVIVGWVRTGDLCDFSTFKPPYLQNGARYDQGYYWTLIATRTSDFDWYQNQRPWMTLNWPWAAITPLRSWIKRWRPSATMELHVYHGLCVSLTSDARAIRLKACVLVNVGYFEHRMRC